MEIENIDLILDNYEDLIKTETKVTVNGSIWRIEKNKDKFYWIYLRKSRIIIPCRLTSQHPLVQTLRPETNIKVHGTLKIPKNRSLQPFEIECKDITLISKVSPQLNRKNNELSSLRFLYVRRPDIQLLLQIKSKIRSYLIDYIEDQGYFCVETPIITSFNPIGRMAFETIISQRTDFSEKNKYLSQTAQFYLEALAHSFEKVYTFSPAFRAYYRDSKYVLAEFLLLEGESLHLTFQEVMSLQEKMLENLCQRLYNENQTLFYDFTVHQLLAKRFSEVKFRIHQLSNDFWDEVEKKVKPKLQFINQIKSPFPRINYQEITKQLQEKGEFFNDTHLRERLGHLITDNYKKPAFITLWPFGKRQFYTKKCPKEPKFTHTFDLIAHNGYGEISSGGEREHREEVILEQIREKKLRLEDNNTLRWYSKFQLYGNIPHSGFSLGLERVTAWLTQVEHINMTVAFPRRKIGTDIYY